MVSGVKDEKLANIPRTFTNLANVSGPLCISESLIARLPLRITKIGTKDSEQHKPKQRKTFELFKHLRIHVVLHHLPIRIVSNTAVKADEFGGETAVFD
jgi:hypothetical protein